ncbi:hypothetical protein VRZ08_15725 [Rhodopseudomonas sp. G2_2311]|uniref:hypothetical protein n=1 Tax=Rhodopseudomonas sp. G2_2311 TaxID=3114287 RepID=UPI0039C69552
MTAGIRRVLHDRDRACGLRLGAAAGLRFAAFQIGAQRLGQPLLATSASRGRILHIGHGEYC